MSLNTAYLGHNLTQVAIRLPVPLLDAMEQIGEVFSKKTPGTSYSRSDMIRIAMMEFAEKHMPNPPVAAPKKAKKSTTSSRR